MKHYAILKTILLFASFVLGSFHSTAQSVTWFDGTHPVTLYLSSKVEPVVKVAAGMFSNDMKEVTGQPTALVGQKSAIIRVVQLNAEPSLSGRLSALGFPIDSIRKYKESFCIRTVANRQVCGGQRRSRRRLRTVGAFAPGRGVALDMVGRLASAA